MAGRPPVDTASKLDNTTRLSVARSCSGLRAVAQIAAVAEGLATMRRRACRASAAALTSGTTSGTSGSMRKASLSSMTIAPASAARGM